MKNSIRMAKDMLKIAKDLVSSDFSDRNTYNEIIKTKTTMPQFKKLKQVFQPKKAGEEDDLSEASMDRIAEELLAVAKELVGE